MELIAHIQEVIKENLMLNCKRKFELLVKKFREARRQVILTCLPSFKSQDKGRKFYSSSKFSNSTTLKFFRSKCSTMAVHVSAVVPAGKVISATNKFFTIDIQCNTAGDAAIFGNDF